jgi:hypothetical protein
VSTLRAAGWRLPPEVPDDYLLRVYDARVESGWLHDLAAEVTGMQLRTLVVGGDFLTQPHLEDHVALNPKEIRRWGLAGDEPYRIVVPPRPHQAAWAERCAAQMRVEAPGSVLVWCAVVPRDRIGAGAADQSALRRLLPQAGALFEAKDLRVDVKVVGERAPLRRVPAKSERDMVLPPTQWERAWLPVDRVLLAVVVQRTSGTWLPPSCGAVRGELPMPTGDDLELLRLEYVLPPATKQANADKAMRGAVRKLAKEMAVPLPPGAEVLRQVVVQHGGVLAILAVPRDQAVTWLRGSGCGGLYLRPFWTSATGAAVDRNQFYLLWLRGKADRGAELWETFRGRQGVVGLLLNGRDVALRVDSSAKVEELQAQLTLTFGDQNERFRRATAGQRWWRLGPLTEPERWRAAELVRSMGLEPLRGDFRYGRMGRWRHCAYFAAVGNPSRTSLDTGKRNDSEAYLLEVGPPRPPPVRTTTATAVARPRGTPAGSLPATTTWAGPRTPSPPFALSPQPPPASASVPPPVAAPAAAAAAAVPRPQRRAGDGRGKAARGMPQASPGSGSGAAQRHAPRDELVELRALIEDLRMELRALRRENELLRRAQVVAPAPMALLPPLPSTPLAFTPLPAAQFTPVTPIKDSGDTEMDLTNLGPREREPGGTPGAKRTPGVARALEVSPSNA